MKGSTKDTHENTSTARLIIGNAQIEIEIARQAADTLTKLVVMDSISCDGNFDENAFSVFMLGIDAQMKLALSEIDAAMKLLA